MRSLRPLIALLTLVLAANVGAASVSVPHRPADPGLSVPIAASFGHDGIRWS